MEKFTSASSDFAGAGQLTHSPRRKSATTPAKQSAQPTSPHAHRSTQCSPQTALCPPVLFAAQLPTGRRPPTPLARRPVDIPSTENIPQFITRPRCTIEAQRKRFFQLSKWVPVPVFAGRQSALRRSSVADFVEKRVWWVLVAGVVELGNS